MAQDLDKFEKGLRWREWRLVCWRARGFVGGEMDGWV